MELKDSRMKNDDPRVQKCLLIYPKATRDEGKKRNETFEMEGYVQTYLADYEKKSK